MYHVTSLGNVESIEKNGIIANRRGEIFVITDPIVANEIAKSQLFLDEYAIFGIEESAITGCVIEDQVAEFTRSPHRIILQDRIEPNEIFLLGELDTVVWEPVEWDYILGEQLGKSRAQVDEEFRMRKKAMMPIEEVTE